MKIGLLLGIGVLGIGVFLLLRRTRQPKYSIGEYIIYCGTEYLVTNNREKDTQGRLLYQLENQNTHIAYWFLVSDVDADICVT
jgi:hypothetical protein